MNQAEQDLLISVITGKASIRQLGDAPAAKGLQSAQMATFTYLDEGARISVKPTDRGRRWYALQQHMRKTSGNAEVTPRTHFPINQPE